MNPPAKKDYYEILGASESSTQREIERLYKRRAAQSHPDRGGNEEEMKTLNEAYGVLGNAMKKEEYDRQRVTRTAPFVPVTSPTASDVGLLGQGLSAFLCLLLGLFLLVLVRSQWFWFLWPLAILSILVILFGVMLARGTLRAFNSSLPTSHRFRRLGALQEAVFWCAVLAGGYGVYILLTAV